MELAGVHGLNTTLNVHTLSPRFSLKVPVENPHMVVRPWCYSMMWRGGFLLHSFSHWGFQVDYIWQWLWIIQQAGIVESSFSPSWRRVPSSCLLFWTYSQKQCIGIGVHRLQGEYIRSYANMSCSSWCLLFQVSQQTDGASKSTALIYMFLGSAPVTHCSLNFIRVLKSYIQYILQRHVVICSSVRVWNESSTYLTQK